MKKLPEEFLQTMQEILGEDYKPFLASYDEERHFSLRINKLKTDEKTFEERAPFQLERIPWIEGGYYYGVSDRPAAHPFYAAGLYYLQEASAMTPASRLPVRPGDRVLDLCAAPGGKATELGARLAGQGILVANDVSRSRARALLRNIELFGISNAFVTSEKPHVLAGRFPDYFDKIMVDAPCSGEGMFFRNPEVIDAWMEKGPDYFSGIQKEIIARASDMLRPGGMMMYSTCTFSPLENEAVITDLLLRRPEMELVPMEDYCGFSQGLPGFRGERFHQQIGLCRRIWPHRMPGQGHFMALLRKRGGGQDRVNVSESFSGKHKKGKTGGPCRNWYRHIRLKDAGTVKDLEAFFSKVKRPFSPEEMEIRSGKLYYVPGECGKMTGGLTFLRNGVCLGELKKNRFEPSQPLALMLSEKDFAPSICLAGDDPRTGRYLKGESFDTGDLIRAEKKGGYVLVTVEGYPLGFAKVTGNTLKNKYPSGWRRKD
ncbi:MAG: RsmB/NOP family class I SAM-dependent RNA methyltransferase [Eubacterium sp.]|nr:RsmB/NOP family class I SAM-dependent RNA methyltransferase [Eubacterium sp.]